MNNRKVKRLMKRFILSILLSLFLITGVMAGQLTVPAIDQDYYTAIMGYKYICGPTVGTEIIAYWSINGFPDLMVGEPNGQIPDKSIELANLFREYYPVSGWSGGYTYPQDLKNGLINFFNHKGYDVEVILTAKGVFSQTGIKAEIDAGRPVILLNWNWNHYVVITGYSTTSTGTVYTILYGHVPIVRTGSASAFGSVYGLQVLYVRPVQSVPEVTPINEPWYSEAKSWCDANGWEIEKKD